MAVSLEEQLKAVDRELGMRRHVYPRRVQNGMMSQAQADAQIAAMEAVRETVQKAAQAERLL